MIKDNGDTGYVADMVIVLVSKQNHLELPLLWQRKTGTQATSEAAYTSYARQAVARTAGGWAVTGNTADNVAAITYPEATGGSETETFFGIGTAVSGAGNLIVSGALTASLAVSTGITPEFAIGDCNVTAD